MSRIPKSAQRAIDKANRERLLRHEREIKHLSNIPAPRMMDIARTPRSIINMYDVYFNGEKQTLCTYANVNEGKIIRWSHGIGNRPAKDAELVSDTGKVEIRLKV